MTLVYREEERGPSVLIRSIDIGPSADKLSRQLEVVRTDGMVERSHRLFVPRANVIEETGIRYGQGFQEIDELVMIVECRDVYSRIARTIKGLGFRAMIDKDTRDTDVAHNGCQVKGCEPPFVARAYITTLSK